jgi:tripartite-type tricarboxylate transporter receptor subunit TctC
MRVTRMLLASLAVIASFANVESAMTQAFPARPVRIVVGYPPGGLSDIVARLIGQSLSERLGQPFVIENRPGAASNIATEAVVHAPADGYTLLLINPANATSATLYDKLNFNFIRDIAPVAGIVRVPNIMEVNPSVPAKTVPEFIAYAQGQSEQGQLCIGGQRDDGTSRRRAVRDNDRRRHGPRSVSWIRARS